ncbi:uncharacterized protein LOC110722761 isoform X2 [Chenopodium quinoa]|uniref:uncharacterized protein LOC110722761 isoform X2 n=1 Tax=Chenopodium quinoa TaxID=63459 RepID=UPI000B77BA17|nr:uncharacterized protein LOC110722761 isoform X2 [Chenopodium quinoa]
MVPLILTLSPPPSVSLSSSFLPPSSLPKLNNGGLLLTQKQLLKLRRSGMCRAELQQDAPFAIAIGACVLNSLLFSDTAVSSPEDEDAAVSSTDARFTVMTIIGFIPYFNWLSWIFALMDTGKRRYAVYALVYLAPYFRTNLSLSPEESWLPIASIVLCVIHIQLEASIRSGDLDGFNFFNKAAKSRGLAKKHDHIKHPEEMQEEARGKGNMKLPLGQQSRDEIRKWRVTRKPSQDIEHVGDDAGDQDDKMQH